MIAVLGAMKQELVGLRRRMNIEDVAHDGPLAVWRGSYRDRDLVLVCTGIGQQRATRATRHVLGRFPCTALVSIGFGGALVDDLAVGDVVLCERLHAEDNSGQTLEADPGLMRACAKTGERLSGSVNVKSGTSISVRLPVCTIERREYLARRYGACLVDMESYWVGSLALAQGVPFLSVRSVSDAADEELPPLDRLVDSDGTWRSAALPFFMTRPWKLASLVRLRRHCGTAARQLTAFLDSLLPALPVGETRQ